MTPRSFVLLTVFAAVTLTLMPLQQLFVWFWPGMARRFPMHYHRMICGLLGIRLRVIGQPPRQGPVLIASNHVSWIDILVLSAIAPLSFIAKREVGPLALLRQPGKAAAYRLHRPRPPSCHRQCPRRDAGSVQGR